MRTIEIKLYKFEELSEEAKQKVIEKMYDINVDDAFWYEFIYEDFEEKAKQAGFDVSRGKRELNIYWSGFWSQGDGAMFEYDGLDKSLLIEFVDQLKLSPMRKQWLKSQVIISGNGKHSGHYYHENCCYHSINFEPNFQWSEAINFNNWIESFIEEFENFVIDKYKDLCKELYRSLEKEYEYQTSKEAIIETIQANDYEFTEDGTLN